MEKYTLVLGASEKMDRYSNKAIRSLLSYGYLVRAIGNRVGEVQGVPIEKGFVNFENIDTVTLYLNPKNQEFYYDYIMQLQPRRVIFNPGTENAVFRQQLESQGIECDEACTLVLLSTRQY